MRRTPSRKSCVTPAGFSNCGPVSDIRIVKTLRASKPGFTCRTARKVRISRAAPTSSTRASAISVVTSSARVLWCNPVPLRLLLSFKLLFKSAREDCSAGTSPNSMPVTSDKTRVNPKTRQSKPALVPRRPMRGILRDAQNGANPGVSCGEADNAAGQRQHNAFRQKLTHDPAPARPQ